MKASGDSLGADTRKRFFPVAKEKANKAMYSHVAMGDVELT